MTKRLLAALIAVAAMLTGAVVSTAPASAQATEWPATITGFRFWTGHVCMAVGDTGINAAVVAQQWNNVTAGTNFAIQASNNCVTAGYTPSTRFTIDTYYAADGTCGKMTNPDGTTDIDSAYYNGMWRYTNNPVIWVNTYGSSCRDHQAHYVAASIGQVMGLAVLNSDGYNSRVMNMTNWSIQNVSAPSVYDGVVAENIYAGTYGG